MLNLSHSTIDIAITCSDFEASLDFYHNKLGLEIVLELEIPDDLARGVGLAPTGFRQVRLQAGNTLSSDATRASVLNKTSTALPSSLICPGSRASGFRPNRRKRSCLPASESAT